jgi:hypothetical protein
MGRNRLRKSLRQKKVLSVPTIREEPYENGQQANLLQGNETTVGWISRNNLSAPVESLFIEFIDCWLERGSSITTAMRRGSHPGDDGSKPFLPPKLLGNPTEELIPLARHPTELALVRQKTHLIQIDQ